MKNILLLLHILIPLIGFAQSQSFRIEGHTTKKNNGKYIKLVSLTDHKLSMDSTLVQDGKYVFQGFVNQTQQGCLYIGNDSQGDYLNILIVEGTTNITSTDSLFNAKIEGNQLVIDNQSIEIKLRPIQILYRTHAQKANANNPYNYQWWDKSRKEIILDFIKANPDSFSALYHLNKLASQDLYNYERYINQYESISDRLKTTALGQELHKKLEQKKGDLYGKLFYDFTSTTPSGEVLKIKDIVSQNQYTFLDFWASWCVPCRKENPYVVKTFNEFEGNGFEVVSISLDTDKNKWMEAIEKDGMPWHHGSSLKGFKDETVDLYKIKSIPYNLLIDKNGKIIATNLRGEDLFNKINSLVNKAKSY